MKNIVIVKDRIEIFQGVRCQAIFEKWNIFFKICIQSTLASVCLIIYNNIIKINIF